jgi:hypothetical protein
LVATVSENSCIFAKGTRAMKGNITRKDERYHLKTSVSGNENVVYRFNIEYYVFMEGCSYIAYCSSLDLSTSARSVAEAKHSFREMFQLYADSCVENETLLHDILAHSKG